MKIFVDSANLLEIEEALDRGFPAGITTNPSILAKEEKGDFREHIKKIIELVQRYGYDIPLSVEVFSTKREEMITQAEDFVRHFGHYPNLNVKIPVGWDELAVIRELRSRGIRVNCTCCMSYNQAVMAAGGGRQLREPLLRPHPRHRLRRGLAWSGRSGRPSGSATYPCEIIVGSIRHIADINEALQAGADIVTVPPKFFRQMVSHPKTDEAVHQFVTDFKKWLE